MSRSEFVIAVYQAAMIREQLRRDAKLKAHQVELPYSLAMQASHTSPFIFNGHISEAAHGKRGGDWEYIGEFLVQTPKK